MNRSDEILKHARVLADYVLDDQSSYLDFIEDLAYGKKPEETIYYSAMIIRMNPATIKKTVEEALERSKNSK
jgi:predicted Zn-dependent protease